MFFIIIGATLCLDQITKWLVINNIQPYKEIIKINSFLNLVHIRNTGMAFGLFSGKGDLVQVFFIISSLIAVIALSYYHFTSKIFFLKTVACSLIIGGALGNLIDRLFYGNVIDFIDFHIGKYHWPAFNIADSVISIGVFLLFLCFYRERD
ncbi:MAG: signal peptidase II [Candidatus Desulfofervidus auxilii]|nr:signal peptidase II [Candidatus Desulfofervidus auxilii]